MLIDFTIQKYCQKLLFYINCDQTSDSLDFTKCFIILLCKFGTNSWNLYRVDGLQNTYLRIDEFHGIPGNESFTRFYLLQNLLLRLWCFSSRKRKLLLRILGYRSTNLNQTVFLWFLLNWFVWRLPIHAFHTWVNLPEFTKV